MNKFASTVLKQSTLFLLLILFSKYHTFAQEKFTTIKKNINKDAVSLFHDLSKNGDSLIVKSDSLIFQIEFLNDRGNKLIEFDPPCSSAKISLKDFSIGNYTALVFERDKIIVFEISRLMEFNNTNLFNNELALHDENIEKPIVHIPLDLKNPNSINNISLFKESFASNSLNVKQGYNLTNGKRENVQTREHFRKTNLRPNGKPYN